MTTTALRNVIYSTSTILSIENYILFFNVVHVQSHSTNQHFAEKTHSRIQYDGLQSLCSILENIIPQISSVPISSSIERSSNFVARSYKEYPKLTSNFVRLPYVNDKMPLKLYSNFMSPPVRAVLFALKTLDLPFEKQHVDIQNSDHKTEQYLKMNPAHTIPTLVDEDDFAVFDSHAINTYLVQKYADNDELYPSDCKEQAAVNQVMYFECGTMFRALKFLFEQFCLKKTITCLTNEIVNMVEDIYEVLEKLLDGKDYVAKQGITIADFSVIPSLTSLNIIVAVDSEKFPQLSAYMERCRNNFVGYEEINEPATEAIRAIFSEIDLQLPSD